eukprot:1161613-Pelagomonas_calceolata.AAC.2
MAAVQEEELRTGRQQPPPQQQQMGRLALLPNAGLGRRTPRAGNCGRGAGMAPVAPAVAAAAATGSPSHCPPHPHCHSSRCCHLSGCCKHASPAHTPPKYPLYQTAASDLLPCVPHLRLETRKGCFASAGRRLLPKDHPRRQVRSEHLQGCCRGWQWRQRWWQDKACPETAKFLGCVETRLQQGGQKLKGHLSGTSQTEAGVCKVHIDREPAHGVNKTWACEQPTHRKAAAGPAGAGSACTTHT